MRTCVGCRTRDAVANLLRVVAVNGACVPDPERRRPGRGAHLHACPGCLEQAERRRALPRALRVSPPLDVEPVRRYIGDLGDLTG